MVQPTATATPDARPDATQACAARFSPATAAQFTALARALPAPEAEALVALVTAIADETYRATLDGVDYRWQRILAHVPSLAPALQLVEDHVLGLESPCPVCESAPPRAKK